MEGKQNGDKQINKVSRTSSGNHRKNFRRQGRRLFALGRRGVGSHSRPFGGTRRRNHRTEQKQKAPD